MAERKIYLNGVIGQSRYSFYSAEWLSWMINCLAHEDSLHLFINSPGGDIDEAAAMYEMIKTCNNQVYTYAAPQISSAAVIVFLAAEKERRFVSKFTTALLHQPAYTIQGGTKKDLADAIVVLNGIQTAYTDVVAERTGSDVSAIVEEGRTLMGSKLIELGFAVGFIGQEVEDTISANHELEQAAVGEDNATDDKEPQKVDGVDNVESIKASAFASGVAEERERVKRVLALNKGGFVSPAIISALSEGVAVGDAAVKMLEEIDTDQLWAMKIVAGRDGSAVVDMGTPEVKDYSFYIKEWHGSKLLQRHYWAGAEAYARRMLNKEEQVK